MLKEVHCTSRHCSSWYFARIPLRLMFDASRANVAQAAQGQPNSQLVDKPFRYGALMAEKTPEDTNRINLFPFVVRPCFLFFLSGFHNSFLRRVYWCLPSRYSSLHWFSPRFNPRFAILFCLIQSEIKGALLPSGIKVLNSKAKAGEVKWKWQGSTKRNNVKDTVWDVEVAI